MNGGRTYCCVVWILIVVKYVRGRYSLMQSFRDRYWYLYSNMLTAIIILLHGETRVGGTLSCGGRVHYNPHIIPPHTRTHTTYDKYKTTIFFLPLTRHACFEQKTRKIMKKINRLSRLFAAAYSRGMSHNNYQNTAFKYHYVPKHKNQSSINVNALRYFIYRDKMWFTTDTKISWFLINVFLPAFF